MLTRFRHAGTEKTKYHARRCCFQFAAFFVIGTIVLSPLAPAFAQTTDASATAGSDAAVSSTAMPIDGSTATPTGAGSTSIPNDIAAPVTPPASESPSTL